MSHRPNPGNTPLIAFRHAGVDRCSSSSGSLGAWRPSIAIARWRAHSLLPGVERGWTVGGCCDGRTSLLDRAPAVGSGGEAVGIISVIPSSCGVVVAGRGALATLLPPPPQEVKRPVSVRDPTLLPNADPPSIPICCVGPLSPSDTRSLILRTILSRRTIAFVTLRGQYPRGRAVFLHIGHSELLSFRNVSTHSGWKMWWQGNSRTMVPSVSGPPGTKSSRQMAQVGCWSGVG